MDGILSSVLVAGVVGAVSMIRSYQTRLSRKRIFGAAEYRVYAAYGVVAYMVAAVMLVRYLGSS